MSVTHHSNSFGLVLDTTNIHRLQEWLDRALGVLGASTKNLSHTINASQVDPAVNGALAIPPANDPALHSHARITVNNIHVIYAFAPPGVNVIAFPGTRIQNYTACQIIRENLGETLLNVIPSEIKCAQAITRAIKEYYRASFGNTTYIDGIVQGWTTLHQHANESIQSYWNRIIHI
ncbi:hypothetical protein BCR33DRAFT_750588 [Rhizoclosmatium globosum]|uniref:Uncharacterized protein n=1 Tax=Rhizoclosmatium globosum TaxID=329046 RepID=A0A1Y2ACC2_9FUNG|nr:hypothetical protein BCR33DRAFT_750588 [Rhizoclosmatium globosum]|eukprot:ORY20213.1 hypothetical protein BCR33DRAFT_750588 [Rhizoclosmatium globosum]